jgi:hypothetical protein
VRKKFYMTHPRRSPLFALLKLFKILAYQF